MYKFTYSVLTYNTNLSLKYNFSKSYNYLKYNNNLGIKKYNFNINLNNNIKICSNQNINIKNKFLIYPIIDIAKYIQSCTNNYNFECNVYQIRYIINKQTKNIKINRLNDDFVVPMILINSVNIDTIFTNIYTKNNRKIQTLEIKDNQYIILNNRDLLYNFENVNHKINSYNFQNYGFLDILQIGLSINT